MYLDVKLGKKGEVVIPVLIRRMLKLQEGDKVRLNVSQNKVEFVAPARDVVAYFREIARREGIPKSRLLYGDRLYEEVFH